MTHASSAQPSPPPAAEGETAAGAGGRPARLRPEERRAQILDAARRVLEADPHRELTVELVAAEARVSPALLFHYFGSKKNFQFAVIEAAATELMLRTAPDPDLPPDEQLRAGITAFVRTVLEAPQLYRATLLMSAAGDPAVRTLHSELRQTFSHWVIDAVTQLGVERTARVELVCLGWQAYVEQTLLTWIDHPTVSPAELEDLCERSLAALLTTTTDVP